MATPPAALFRKEQYETVFVSKNQKSGESLSTQLYVVCISG